MRLVRPPVAPPSCEHTADDGPLPCRWAKKMTNDDEKPKLLPKLLTHVNVAWLVKAGWLARLVWDRGASKCVTHFQKTINAAAVHADIIETEWTDKSVWKYPGITHGAEGTRHAAPTEQNPARP